VYASAEVIHLKNGRTIWAEHVRDTGTHIEYDLGDDTYAIPKSAVDQIEAGGLRGTILVRSERVGDVYRMCIELRNENAVGADQARNQALGSAFVSAHFVLAAQSGAFASMLDAPDVALPAVARCRNERLYPVLTGEQQPGANTSPLLLLSPIILYDFPRIAQASKTRTFDGTEIDELLMLSVASLTDEEKRDARAAHPYVRELVERAEALDAQTLATLHGELTGGAREPGDETVDIAGVMIGKGARVRVFPKGRADVWDDIVRGNIDPPNVGEAVRHPQQVALFEQTHSPFVEPPLQLWARLIQAPFGFSLYGALTAASNLVHALGQTQLLLLFSLGTSLDGGWQYLWQARLPFIGYSILIPLLVTLVAFYVMHVRAHHRLVTTHSQLEAAYQQLATSAKQIESLTLLTERQRIARDLHDTLSQDLVGLIRQLDPGNLCPLCEIHNRESVEA